MRLHWGENGNALSFKNGVKHCTDWKPFVCVTGPHNLTFIAWLVLQDVTHFPCCSAPPRAQVQDAAVVGVPLVTKHTHTHTRLKNAKLSTLHLHALVGEGSETQNHSRATQTLSWQSAVWAFSSAAERKEWDKRGSRCVLHQLWPSSSSELPEHQSVIGACVQMRGMCS